MEFTRYVIGLRKGHAVLRRRKFFQGRSIRGAGVQDIAWYEPRGKEMTDKAWADHFARCLGVLLMGIRAGGNRRDAVSRWWMTRSSLCSTPTTI